jgi:hypothetical protein
MSSYELVQILPGRYVYTTSPSVLQWAENELRKRLPLARFYERRTFWFSIWSVDPITREIEEPFWEVMRQLMQQGWEPFAIDQGTCWLRRQLPD